ncbi:MAG: phospholipid carrier-dependent glycosyltransferase [Phycisphaerae bacterium]|nr:phospholipid carrier-dependent glycosyltransferase [Phycisphaerae bacterium]
MYADSYHNRSAIVEDDQRFHWMDIVLIVIFCVAFFGFHLGSEVPLTDHEALVAVTAQNTLEHGHWVVPHYNDQIRLQKTPLMYWVVAAVGYLAGGISETVVRAPSAVSAGAIALMMYLLALRMFDRVMGLITGLATASCAAFLWQSHIGIADTMMTAFVVASMFCFWFAFSRLREEPGLGTKAHWLYLAGSILASLLLVAGAVAMVKSLLPALLAFGLAVVLLIVLSVYLPSIYANKTAKRKSTFWIVLGYVFFALGMLAKGPVPLLAVGAPIFFYLIYFAFQLPTPQSVGPVEVEYPKAWTSRWFRLGLSRLVADLARFQVHWGVLILLLVVGSWALAVLLTLPDAMYRWREEYISRFVGQFGTERPWHYYIPLVFVLGLPWTVFLPVGLVLPFLREVADRRRELVFVFVWLAADLAFFSLSKGKRAHYILPLAPAAVMLSVAGMVYCLHRWITTRNVLVVMGAIFGGTLIAGFFGWRYIVQELPQLEYQFYGVFGIILAVELLSTLVLLRWGVLAMATVIAIGTGFVFAIVWTAFPLIIDPEADPRRVAERIRAETGPDAEVYFLGRADGPLVYYFGRPIPQIPTDQQITAIVLKATDKTGAIADLYEATATAAFEVMDQPGRQYFLTSDQKYALAMGYANAENRAIREVMRVSNFFSDTKGLVLFTDVPAATQAAATQSETP